MTSFNSVRTEAYDRVQRQQYYQSNVAGLTAFQRHSKYVNDYLQFYGGAGGAARQPATVKTDFDTLKESYRFLRSEEDDAGSTWEVRLARKYYNKLFREYAIADLSRYKDSKVGLRWRTQTEVVEGKGQFICGGKGCNSKDGLTSYEVNFAYQEAGQRKQALVKVRLCPECAYKLNYRKNKALGRAHSAAPSRHRSKSPPRKRSRHKADSPPQERDEDAAGGDAAPPPEPDTQQPPAGGGGAGGAGGGAVLSGDESIWEQRPQEEGVVPEEEYEDYFQGLFL